MAQFKIKGGNPLKGTIKVSGNKNSALPLIAASLVVDGPVKLTNVPNIRDVESAVELIEKLGVKVAGLGTGTLEIDASDLTGSDIDPDLARKFRASVIFAAPLLARFGKITLPSPGGDSIGERLIDTHFQLLSEFGASIKEKDGIYEITATNLKVADIFLEKASVTATEMGLILASTLPGETIIEDAAAEPHVKDLAEFLVKAGAQIEGAGTNTIIINGKKSLKGVEHKVRPDHIEVGTFAIAAAITGGNVRIEGAVADDLDMILLYLSDMGVKYKLDDNVLSVIPSELVEIRKEFHTRPWPGFPTDLMSAFIVLATQTKGVTLCHDWMYEWRIFFVDYLIKMGADITIADPHRIIVTGPTKLHGEIIPTTDIRAGVALILAALVAEGNSTVEHAEIVERGYEDLETRLSALGAQIEKVE
ncbi:UDP-N-acetylglucosamine 1-carboxyvinyltransferase [Candidatus Microgenomates bacterium]|nr:UDP-N-acetylglucosamine 1-carboxyvinyltransferase [Candidatus Microgenomates bacterium]